MHSTSGISTSISSMVASSDASSVASSVASSDASSVARQQPRQQLRQQCRQRCRQLAVSPALSPACSVVSGVAATASSVSSSPSAAQWAGEVPYAAGYSSSLPPPSPALHASPAQWLVASSDASSVASSVDSSDASSVARQQPRQQLRQPCRQRGRQLAGSPALSRDGSAVSGVAATLARSARHRRVPWQVRTSLQLSNGLGKCRHCRAPGTNKIARRSYHTAVTPVVSPASNLASSFAPWQVRTSLQPSNGLGKCRRSSFAPWQAGAPCFSSAVQWAGKVPSSSAAVQPVCGPVCGWLFELATPALLLLRHYCHSGAVTTSGTAAFDRAPGTNKIARRSYHTAVTTVVSPASNLASSFAPWQVRTSLQLSNGLGKCRRSSFAPWQAGAPCFFSSAVQWAGKVPSSSAAVQPVCGPVCGWLFELATLGKCRRPVQQCSRYTAGYSS
jgi:hypothetical protein